MREGDPVLAAETRLWQGQAARARAGEVAASVGVLILLLLVWQFAVVALGISPLLLPPPLEVARRLAEDVIDPRWLGDLGSTAVAMIGGFAIGSVVGILLGALLATRPKVERILHPWFVAFQTFPKVAIAPLLSVWLGYAQAPKIALAAILAFFPVMVNALAGFRATRAEEIELMRVMDASGLQTFLKVRLPNALDYVFAGIEMALIFALLGTITAEVLGSRAGLGHLLIVRMSMLDVPGVFALLVSFAVLGTACYLVGSFIHKRVVFWR